MLRRTPGSPHPNAEVGAARTELIWHHCWFGFANGYCRCCYCCHVAIAAAATAAAVASVKSTIGYWRLFNSAYVWLMDAAVASAAAATAAVSTIASTVAAAALRLWLYLLSS